MPQSRTTHTNSKKRRRDAEYSKTPSVESDHSVEKDSSGEESEEEEEEDDYEGPRVSQWVDEDEEDEALEEPEEQEDMKQVMSRLSFGALLKAKRALAQQQEENESSQASASDEDDSEGSQGQTAGANEDLRPGEHRERKPKEKRANKHAPMEMSSKRQVTRRRTVVEVTAPKNRDPRFGEAVGEYSAEHFLHNYEFLSGVRQGELQTIRESLARAKRLLGSSPAALRAERQAEVDKLERTMKRAESAIERTKRTAFERETMLKVKRDERQKRASGKREWHLKKGDEKKLQLQARFDSMSGKEAKKAIEKKRKKIAQKEKKSRPFATEYERDRSMPSSSSRQFPVGHQGRKRAWGIASGSGGGNETPGAGARKRRRFE
ncbi:hypothetical protein M408DRAFT_333288 [Serendipita vermifera MAFF 305830]|uniref:rRNA biogenesis protein RRP36 n=1 Tax=Serendipita vermifera MAFF 305830 TaxID=933852 RepID=A0A0C3AAT4_SERVB|nr:hypothetical protein M408DRAFT_333288 [Serendipita vermifera MAFF 305830]